MIEKTPAARTTAARDKTKVQTGFIRMSRLNNEPISKVSE